MKTPSNQRFSLRFLGPVTTLLCCFIPVGQTVAGNLAVGFGAGYSAAEYKGVEDQSTAIPVIEYEIGRFSFYPLGASVRLATIESSPIEDPTTGEDDSRYKLHFFGSVNVADDERDNDDSLMFLDMETRDMGSSVGVSALFETPFGMFSASHLTDVSNSSEGSITTLAYGLPLYGSQHVFIGGNIGVNIVDEKWNDYYYGVRESEATDNRAAYEASRSVNPFMELSATYAFNQHWSVTQNAMVSQIDDTVVDSPLTVDDDIHSEFTLSVLYTF